jgi:predicted DNA-binding transcriptional regulator YafY
MPAPAARPKDDAATVRCLRLAQWLLAQDEPASRERIYAAFPREYAGSAAAREKKFGRDKAQLRDLGFALETVELGGREEATGYLLDARSSTLPPVEFTPDEAALLWAAGTGALRLSDHPLRDELENALRKLVIGGKGMPPRAAATEELSADGELDASVQRRQLDKLTEAWTRRKTITIDYWRAGTGQVVTRQVDVYGWALRRGEWILVGHCHLRQAVRIFYLSRCRSLKMNGVRAQTPDYQLPAGFDIRGWSRQEVWDYDVHPPRHATVRLRGSLARIARQLLPEARLSTEPSGARLARLEVRNLRGLVRQALAWGLEAELVEPAEGRAMAREILARVVAAGNGAGP